jgi:hypothetical protein
LLSQKDIFSKINLHEYSESKLEWLLKLAVLRVPV